jgi:dTDP-4-dehydrorhamnose reductase
MGVYDKILVTGGGGMLAQALIGALRARGLEPFAPNRAALDITSFADVMQTIENVRPTLILNCAAHTKVDLCEEQEDLATQINGSAVGVLAAAAKDVGAKLVHYSTDFVFNGNSTTPWREDAPTDPLSAYGRSKFAGEHLIARDGGPDALILRTAWLYGPGGPCFPMTMINAAKSGKPLKVVADQIGSPTFTHDLADATLNLVDASAAGIYHVVNSGQTNWYEFTAAILEEFDLKTELSQTTSAEWKKSRPTSAIRPAYSVLDTSKYTQATGKTMPDWRVALGAYHRALESVGNS